MVEEILGEKGEGKPWLEKLENLWKEKRKEEVDEGRIAVEGRKSVFDGMSAELMCERDGATEAEACVRM